MILFKMLIIYPYWILNTGRIEKFLKGDLTYNLSILDFKYTLKDFAKWLESAYNLSILDFKCSCDLWKN